ncbi:flagellar biosynthesis protein FlhB [Methylibium petroleiphilum]|uniref:Flagellar biosynthetic protein FlhB n=2 Tax=Methylibium TaxID=316612 RepID=A2SKE1_METPP|nr:flagellar biosynthesis protein FlhB [Methylibium petroleiphilum]ABM96030.1 flagellar biosynthesis protein [Methylibium petroleiphilum PM1]
MADQGAQDRNLPASERKLKKAREDGQVPRSRDLGHFAAVAAGIALLAAMAPTATGWMTRLLQSGLRFDAGTLNGTASMSERLAELGVQFAWAMLPIGAVMVLAALASSLTVGGWNFTLKAIEPKFSKLNPLTGLPRMLSADRLVDTVRSCVLALVIGLVGAFYLSQNVFQFTSTLTLPLPTALAQAGNDVLYGLMFLLLALAVFALIDVPLQRFQHAKRLKMSHQEMKQEHKENEGNVEVKAKVKARMREMANRRMLAAVPKADLVVMNPTHYAVALKYEEGRGGAPRVVAKGADLMAMRIRDLAKDSKVPVLQAPVLARALYAHAELDREIPIALYTAVAQVLAYVYQLRAALAGKAPLPGELPELPVPAELDPHNKPSSDAGALA